MKAAKVMKNNKDIETAASVIKREIEGLQALSSAIDENFSKAVDIIFSLKGRVIVSGMGKSGHIARKIAATLASTGTPALFVHPGEASHGDLGMITEEDALILLSNSGETVELNDIINYAKRFHIPLIGIVRRNTSTLVDASDIAFVLPEIAEASPVNAPTTSTTMMLAWGDALAMAVLERRGFDHEDFHVFHPGGKLGSQLVKIKQLMKSGEDLPLVKESDLMSNALIIMTEKSLGCAAVVDSKNIPIGVITDGDLRRHMGDDLISLKVKDVMTKNPITISEESLASEALALMNEKSITSLCVISKKELSGIIHIHDILRAGVS